MPADLLQQYTALFHQRAPGPGRQRRVVLWGLVVLGLLAIIALGAVLAEPSEPPPAHGRKQGADASSCQMKDLQQYLSYHREIDPLL